MQNALIGSCIHLRWASAQANRPVGLHGSPDHDRLRLLDGGHSVPRCELGGSLQFPASESDKKSLFNYLFQFAYLTWPPGRTRNSFSSEKMTFLHPNVRCWRPKSRRFRLLAMLSKGLCTARMEVIPMPTSTRRTVDLLGCGGTCKC